MSETEYSASHTEVHAQYDPQNHDPQSYGQEPGAGGSTTVYNVEVSPHQPEPEIRQPGGHPQQPYYAPQQPAGGYTNFEAPPPSNQPPPHYHSARAEAPPAYPPQQPAYPPTGQTYPPTAQTYPPGPQTFPQGYAGGAHATPPPAINGIQQVVTPSRPPPGMPGAPGGFGPGAIIRPEIGPPVPWTTELFGFLEDCYGCPLVIIAPCITFGQIAEITDTGYNKCQTAGIIYAFALFLGIPCLYSYTYRTKMRHKFNLREDPLDDFCTHFWCEFCALAQEYRELRYRGIDPSLGYDLQQAVVNQAMAAPVAPRMQK